MSKLHVPSDPVSSGLRIPSLLGREILCHANGAHHAASA